MRRKRVSVVMATHNGEAWLKEQIDSVLSQTMSDFELLIGDDASSDRTYGIVQKYASRDRRIRLFRHDETLGVARNFAFLMERAQGRYIAFCDQDDRWHPRKLERQLKAMQCTEAQNEKMPILLHSDLKLIDGQGRTIAPSYFRKRGYDFPERASLPLMLTRGGVMGNTAMINRPLRDAALPFPGGLKYHDWWLGVVAELEGRRITMEEPLVEYRIHTDNTSGKARWLAGEYRYPWKHRWLPWHDRDRIGAVEVLLSRRISEDQRRILECYLEYLRAEKGWIRHYPCLRRVGFFEGPLSFRVRIALRLAVASMLGKGTV